MALFWMHLYGFHTITLVGGATAQIGDPTWRTTARKDMVKQERHDNTSQIENQLKFMWSNVKFLGDRYGISPKQSSHTLLNNLDWLGRVSILEVLQKMGVGLRMGSLLSRESVKSRLDSEDGMALAEFCYPLLQAWDWWHMFEQDHVKVQIGGADQFGNIVTGVEALKHLFKRSKSTSDTSLTADTQQEPEILGFTVPLLTTSSGEKFGKSAGNAVWLSHELTSSFDLYAVSFIIGS
jgi:tyrosyl-tRNA synthetase